MVTMLDGSPGGYGERIKQKTPLSRGFSGKSGGERGIHSASFDASPYGRLRRAGGCATCRTRGFSPPSRRRRNSRGWAISTLSNWRREGDFVTPKPCKALRRGPSEGMVPSMVLIR